MSGLFNEINEAKAQQQTQVSKARLADGATSQRHTPTARRKSQRHQLNTDVLEAVMRVLDNVELTERSTTIRLSKKEKEVIQDFIYITLRKEGIEGAHVSISKLMRYSLIYLLKAHDKAFVACLKRAFQKSELEF